MVSLLTPPSPSEISAFIVSIGIAEGQRTQIETATPQSFVKATPYFAPIRRPDPRELLFQCHCFVPKTPQRGTQGEQGKVQKMATLCEKTPPLSRMEKKTSVPPPLKSSRTSMRCNFRTHTRAERQRSVRLFLNRRGSTSNAVVGSLYLPRLSDLPKNNVSGHREVVGHIRELVLDKSVASSQ
jgi:hypothetical protein